MALLKTRIRKRGNMRLDLAVNRVLIAVDAFARGIKKNKPRKSKNDIFTVIIVFQQLFGDAVVLQDSLDSYIKLYPKESGCEVILLLRPSVLAFMKETLIIPEDIVLQEVDFKSFLEDYEYYKKIVKKYRNKADIIILPGASLSGEVFLSACNAKRKVGVVRCVDVKRPFSMAVFSRIACTEKIRPDKEDMMLQRHRLLLNYLGDKEYKARLPKLQKKKKIINEEHYCVICPGASKMEKCWPAERFAEVADYIIREYNMNVHLCGGTEEIEFEVKLLSCIKNIDRVISHIGKTTFSDWAAIVQYADIVVGNDSATLHLAAASRRNAICIAGAYDKNLFFPYKVDYLDKEDKLPISLIKSLPCEWCRTKGYFAGYGNKQCKERINKNECVLCIDAITVQDVKREIDKLLNESGE